MPKTRIGFVGIGLMGTGMARNLISAGFPVSVYDIDRKNCSAIVQEGGTETEDPAQLANHSDVIILSLPNSHVVNEVVKHSLKLFETEKKGLILLDTTTADPILSETLALELLEKEIFMLDVTLSGTAIMCAERDLTLMVGGKEAIYQQCEAIFNAIAKQFFYLGKNGSGALMKLIVNLVLGLNRMVLAEGLALGEQAGMESSRVLEILKNSAAYSKAMDMKGDRMVEKNYRNPEGKLAFHRKDVGLILDLGKRLDFPLPLSSVHAQALASLVAKDRGEWDNASIISFYKDLVNSDS
ncbi:MAG: NAD(P)-dependent oxidoreductase [SAR324 cluster bacterium]|nr:NAD(P)-dependent oxidoreductase [SAR324 cluster bacterium]